MTKTMIRWTDYSWNPTTGCSHVSDGCEHCYAEALSLRFGWSKKPWKAQNAAENVILHPERLEKPLAWERRAQRTGQTIRVFTNSMSDLFHELVPFEFIDQVFRVMEACPHVTFQILTKRPERMCNYAFSRLARRFMPRATADGVREFRGLYERDTAVRRLADGYLLPNCWLGTSVEDQRRADERIPLLVETPAAVRFLSCEPLLGPVALWPYLSDNFARHAGSEPPSLHWVICGGESGPGYRFADGYLDAARSLRDQCRAAGVPYFHKQQPGPRTEMGQELDGVRWEQFPEVAAARQGVMAR